MLDSLENKSTKDKLESAYDGAVHTHSIGFGGKPDVDPRDEAFYGTAAN